MAPPITGGTAPFERTAVLIAAGLAALATTLLAIFEPAPAFDGGFGAVFLLTLVLPRLAIVATFRETALITFFTTVFAEDFFDVAVTDREAFEAPFGIAFIVGFAAFALIARLTGFAAGFAACPRFSLLDFAIEL
ncbi:MAG: hypothetical protein Q8902_09225 [Bacteroidota bacterium]|nr:hypothetical protein [Bacteroidota bacterium]MDP4233448.1 hypothetical protein [Bacteroidota bacterium]MDP4242314.1 hypothetical protein [Bacteroidota bacterium]